MVVIFLYIILHFICYCQPFSVCPLSESATAKFEKHKRSFFCNQTLNCTQLKTDFYYDYNNFVILYYNQPKMWHNVTLLSDQLSHCGIYVLSVTSSVNVSDSICTKHFRGTLVIDLSENDFTASVDEPRYTNGTCSVMPENEENRFLVNLLNVCPNTTWITKNLRCDFEDGENNSYIFRICEHAGCEVTERLSLEEEFLGKHLVVATSQAYAPFVVPGPSNYTNFTGIVFEILNHLARTYHFSYSLVQSPDDDYGVYRNGNWSGLIGMLKNEEVHMVAAALTVTYDRSRAVDFTNAFYTDPISVMIHMPDKQDMLWRLVGLFSPLIWLSILGVAVLSVYVIYILHIFSAEPATDDKLVGGLNSFRKCIWYVVCCLTNQGVEDQPVTWSSQNFLALWSLASFALISIYSGGLIAMLTTSHVTTPIKDLNSLIAAMEIGEYTICVEGGTALYDTIMNANSDDYIRIRNWLNKNPNNVQINCTDLFLQSSNMAYLAELTYLQQIQIANCMEYPLIILDDQFLTGNLAFAVQKRSRLNALISPSVINAREGGLIAGWKQKYSKQNKFCDIKTPNQRVSAAMHPLSVKTFAGAFVVLAIGLLISIVSFCGELRYIWLSNFCMSKCVSIGEKREYFVTWKKNRLDR